MADRRARPEMARDGKPARLRHGLPPRAPLGPLRRHRRRAQRAAHRVLALGRTGARLLDRASPLPRLRAARRRALRQRGLRADGRGRRVRGHRIDQRARGAPEQRCRTQGGRGMEVSRIVLVLLVACLSGCASTYFRDGGAPPEPRPISIDTWPHPDLWTGVVFNGQKIGFTRRQVRAAAPGSWEIESEAVMRIQFLGVDKRIRMYGVDTVAADLT